MYAGRPHWSRRDERTRAYKWRKSGAKKQLSLLSNFCRTSSETEHTQWNELVFGEKSYTRNYDGAKRKLTSTLIRITSTSLTKSRHSFCSQHQQYIMHNNYFVYVRVFRKAAKRFSVSSLEQQRPDYITTTLIFKIWENKTYTKQYGNVMEIFRIGSTRNYARRVGQFGGIFTKTQKDNNAETVTWLKL